MPVVVVNGVALDVDVSRFDPNHTTLSQWLRALGNTGTKEGCAEGDCGACSIAIAVDGPSGKSWRSMTSCIAPLGLLLGKEVVTAEGLADDDGALHPVQAAMVKHHGSQCGYCTPGFVTSMFEAYERDDLARGDSAAVADQLCGNLCRCTGYRPIRDAMDQALACRDAGVVDADLVQLGCKKTATHRPHKEVNDSGADLDVLVSGAPAPGDQSLKMSRFARPRSLAALLALKHDHKERAVLIGGATELGVLLRKRFTRFPFLVDTGGVAELSIIHRGDASLSITKAVDGETPADFQDCWIIGGSATLADLEQQLRGDAAMAPVVRMLRVFASRQVKNRATLAGNIVTASPISDMAPVLLALGAHLELSSQTEVRVVAVDGFFTGYRKTVLRDDEVVTRIFLPRPSPSARFRTFKVSKRRELDIAIVSAAFFIDERDGVVTRARLAFGGVAATPALAKDAAQRLVGNTVNGARHDIKAALSTTFAPLSDVRAQKEFRIGLVPSLWDRFVDDVHDEAHDGDLGYALGYGADRTNDDAGNHAGNDDAGNLAGNDDDGGNGNGNGHRHGHGHGHGRGHGHGAAHNADASRTTHHDSARGHVTGAARYVDDTAQGRGCLEVWPVRSHVARGTLNRIDAGAARGMPGVRLVITASDIPGENDVGAIRKDEPLLPAIGGEVAHHGQVVAVVVADSIDEARAAAAAVVVDISALPPILGIEAALASNSFHPRLDGEASPHMLRKGDARSALDNAKHRLSFDLHIGGQEHFYLETQAAFAEPGEDGDVHVYSSTQHPSEVQAVISHVLHVARNQIVVTSPRMGGGFGGKETQGNGPAALVALAALRLKKPVRLQYDRDLDMEITGKRHPFYARGEVGFDDDGRVSALVAELYADGGFALDLSESIHDRSLFHIDNCYDVAHVEVSGRVCKTNVVSHTAFRGFGGPQGMLVMEDVMSRVAQHLELDAADVRARNFYSDTAPFGVTPYHQPVDDFRVARLWPALKDSAGYAARKASVAAFNASSTHVKRGLSLTPVKFGISFTASFLNQAGALVVVYRDGSVQVNHGGTEMGQGLYTKVQGITQRELGLPASCVRVMQTQTDKVPNTSATAASSGADLNGAAVVAALHELKSRLRPVAAIVLEKHLGKPVIAADVVFKDGHAFANSRGAANEGVAWAAVAEAAYLRQVSLSATGFYRTPDIGYDKKSARGKPFHYFAYGVCSAEVEVDGTTGMKRVLRVDVLHDVGDSLHPAVDRGQVEGALVQGIGWLTGEELLWSKEGRLLSHSASTYQIPSFSDAPAVFNVQLLDDDTAPQKDVVHGSKAVGEPPFMLALAVREALKDAVAAFASAGGRGGVVVDVPSPLTHEVLFHAIQKARAARVTTSSSSTAAAIRL